MASSLTLDKNKRPILCYISFLQRAVSHCVGGVGRLSLYASKHLYTVSSSNCPCPPSYSKSNHVFVLAFQNAMVNT